MNTQLSMLNSQNLQSITLTTFTSLQRIIEITMNVTKGSRFAVSNTRFTIVPPNTPLPPIIQKLNIIPSSPGINKGDLLTIQLEVTPTVGNTLVVYSEVVNLKNGAKFTAKQNITIDHVKVIKLADIEQQRLKWMALGTSQTNNLAATIYYSACVSKTITVMKNYLHSISFQSNFETCSDHGTFNSKTQQCDCQFGYYKKDCSQDAISEATFEKMVSESIVSSTGLKQVKNTFKSYACAMRSGNYWDTSDCILQVTFGSKEAVCQCLSLGTLMIAEFSTQQQSTLRMEPCGWCYYLAILGVVPIFIAILVFVIVIILVLKKKKNRKVHVQHIEVTPNTYHELKSEGEQVVYPLDVSKELEVTL